MGTNGSNEQPTRIFNHRFIIMALVNTLLFTSFSMINPIIPKYCLSNGMSVSLAGIAAGSLALTALFFRPISGMAADKFNPKWLFMLAGFLGTVAYVLYAISEGFVSTVAIRMMTGACFSVDTTVCMMLVTNFIPREHIGAGIGFFGIGPVLAMSVAPGFGLSLSNSMGFPVAFLVAGGISLLATLMIFLIPYKPSKNASVLSKHRFKKLSSRKQASEGVTTPVSSETGQPTSSGAEQPVSSGAEQPVSSGAEQPVSSGTEKSTSSGAGQLDESSKPKGIGRFIAVEAIFFSFMAGLLSFSNGMETSFVALYSESRGIENISVYFTVSALGVLAARLFSGKVYDRRGLNIIFYPAFALAAVAMVILGFAKVLPMFLLAALIKAVAQGSLQPALQTCCLVSVPPERRGLASSTYYIGPDVMQSLGPMAGGVIIQSFGYSAAYFTCAGLFLIGIVIYIIHTKRTGKSLSWKRSRRGKRI